MLANPTIEFFFDVSATGGDFFTVQDPVKGVVETGAYGIAGNIATDVSAFVIGEISITRGRSRQFDAVQTGTARLVLNNRARTFDPLNTASPYYGNIKPGKIVRISRNGAPFYVGKIDDWDFDYTPDRTSTATVVCVDALGDLSAIGMASWTTVSGQLTGARVSAVLDRPDVNYTANRSIAVGNSTLQADTVNDAENVLAYLQLVASTELGRVFASRSNVITFQDRLSNSDAASVMFADTGTGLRFQAVGISYGTELLFNHTIVSRLGGTTEEFIDTDSAVEFGVRTMPGTTGLLFDTDQQAADMGAFLVGQYAAPELRISSITVNLARLTTVDQNTVAALDLGDVIQITYTPNRVGSAIVREAVIEGIAHDCAPAQHTITLSLGDTTNRAVFTVEDAVYGLVEGLAVIAF